MRSFSILKFILLIAFSMSLLICFGLNALNIMSTRDSIEIPAISEAEDYGGFHLKNIAIGDYNLRVKYSKIALDLHVGNHVSQWYQDKNEVSFLINGWYGVNPDLSIYLEIENNGQYDIINCPLTLKGDIYSVWKIDLGDNLTKFRIIARDNAVSDLGWLAISEPFKINDTNTIKDTKMLSNIAGIMSCVFIIAFSLLLFYSERNNKNKYFANCIVFLLSLTYCMCFFESKPITGGVIPFEESNVVGEVSDDEAVSTILSVPGLASRNLKAQLINDEKIYISPWYASGNYGRVALAYTADVINDFSVRIVTADNNIIYPDFSNKSEIKYKTLYNINISLLEFDVPINQIFKVEIFSNSYGGNPLLAFSEPFHIVKANYIIQDILLIAICGIMLCLCYAVLKNKRITSESLFMGYWIALLSVCSFIDIALIAGYNTKNPTIIFNFFIFVLNLSCFLFAYKFAKNKYVTFKSNNLNLRLKSIISDQKFFHAVFGILLFVFYVLVRLPFLGASPKYDPALYTNELVDCIPNFDFTLASFINNFSLFNHNTLSYAAFMSLGQFIDLGNLYLINIQSMFLNLIAIFAFYKILTRFLDKKTHKYEICALTFIFAFTPQVFGESITMDPDFPVFIFFTCLISAYLYDKKALFVLSSFMLVFTKEMGLIVYAVFAIISFFIILIKQKSLINVTLENFYLFIAGISYVLFYLLCGGGQWGASSPASFSFNTEFIRQCLKVIFLINFRWLICLICLAFLIFVFINRKNRDKIIIQPLEREVMIPLVASMFAFIIFPCSYVISGAHPRYYILSDFFILFFFSLIFAKDIIAKKLRTIILSIVSVLLFISVFFTVDPVMLKLFDHTVFSNKKILTVGLHQVPVNDSIIYNTQHSQPSLLLSQVFHDIKLKETDRLVFITDSNDYYKEGFRIGLITYEDVHTLVDNSSSKLTFKKHDSFVPYVNSSFLTSDNTDALFGLDEFYCISMDWNYYPLQGSNSTAVNLFIDEACKYFSIDETFEVNKNGYKATVYKMASKKI